MSLILEALRKSEAERRRGLAPDVAMELPPPPTSRPRMLAAWLLPALAVAAVLMLAGWWATREPAATASPVPAIEAADTTLSQDAPAPALTPRIEPKPAAPAVQAPVVPMPAVAVQSPSPPMPADPSTAISAARPMPAQPVPARPLPPPPPPPPGNDISNDTSMLPPIRLSMHMWDDVPSRRFVILNGQRMAEGDRYDGITVVTIEPAGVVVESNGARARVPLP